MLIVINGIEVTGEINIDKMEIASDTLKSPKIISPWRWSKEEFDGFESLFFRLLNLSNILIFFFVNSRSATSPVWERRGVSSQAYVLQLDLKKHKMLQALDM